MTAARPKRLRRSELATPGTSPKMIAKAAASDADLVFLDLEDAVAPEQKENARANIIAGLNDLDWGKTVRSYRINGVHTKWCHDDVIEVVTGAGANIDVIIVPKVKAPRDVWFVDDLLTQLEDKLALEPGRIGLELLIEETEALACVEQIAAASPRLEALILGIGDLSASQGIRAGHIGVTDDDSGLIGYPGDMWLRPQPDDRGCTGQRHRRDRRSLCQLRQSRGLPAGRRMGRNPWRSWQVVHSPQSSSHRQRCLRPHGRGDHPGLRDRKSCSRG